MKTKIYFVAGALLASTTTAAISYEFGHPGWAQKPGVVLGLGNAALPPPGLYGFTQVFNYDAKLVGPGAPNVAGVPTKVNSTGISFGALWVPGATFLGANYSAAAVLPFVKAEVGPPINVKPEGMINTYFAPVQLSWRLGNSGFFAKAGLGFYAPTGTINGPNGLADVGNPWWTIQPDFTLSYLNDGWNITTSLIYGMNTKNTITNYRTGDIFQAEFRATKTVGKWTFGPVAYYSGQVTDDRSSAFYAGAINANRYDLWAAGGLIGYDFGPFALNVWATHEFHADASGGTAGAPGVDTASISKGTSVFASLNFRLWGADAPPPPKLQRFK